MLTPPLPGRMFGMLWPKNNGILLVVTTENPSECY